ncbi:response regulator [Melioribacteraceae bacterium 4301-Me]|uniref:response regulator n=1 Tax=Pyranulibacter aquaticus TaxID=3163344 RepID=UPI00359BB384
MITKTKLSILEEIDRLSDSAIKGLDSFPEEICNYLASELELQTVALFEVTGNSNLLVLGRSVGTKKNYLKGSSFSCSSCQLLKDNSEYTIHSNPNCEIQVSEFLVYENCIKFPLNLKKQALLKIAKKTPFSRDDKESLEKIIKLIQGLLNLWISSRGGEIGFSRLPINKIIIDSSQELKNIANQVISHSTILSEKNINTPLFEQLSTIKRLSQNLLITLNDLIELAKIDQGNIPININNVSLSTVINDITTVFKSKLTNPNINLVVDISKELQQKFPIDEQKLRYILINLLQVNIALTARGEIKIKASKASDTKFNITITDTSKGLSKDKLAKFFEPYSLQDINEIKTTTLTGLSLTLVKKYIELLGGTISVNLTENSGISFNITLTKSGDVMDEIKNQITQLSKSETKNKILVIEDDYATSKLLSNYLNKWGYEPTIVSNEEQIKNLINKENYLAVILDIELPHINGLELLKTIHNNPNTKNTPVIVCSIEPEEQKAFLMGAVEYFVKPINYNFLVEVLQSYKLKKDSNVLCVDDDIPTLNLIKQAIESVGYNAIAESVSANVMDLIKDKNIDLAIVDLDMPTPNGFELIKMIKSEKKFTNLPIIIYTGKENYKEDLEKIEGLFDELLEKKSTNIEDLADIINAMINRYELPPPVEEVLKKENVIKILLAEDYKHSQIIVTRLLKKNNFENVVVVENGEAALEMAKKDQFDLILMDMQMPIMNGFEATEKIRMLPNYKDVPIIALTAFAMKGDREKCLEVGATDYIPKPIDSKEFIDKIKYYTQKNNK